MEYKFPHTIESCIGEKIVFKELVREIDGDRLIIENWVNPGKGPVMHTHFQQEEAFTVVKGKIGYQVLGEEPKYAGEGDTICFEAGVPHKFWNAGEEVMHCRGYIKPANTIVFFLSAIYDAQNKTGGERPEKFDAAYLLTRYSAEYDLPEVPRFVKKVIFPITYSIGKILGKYKHFENAPAPLARSNKF